MLRVLLRRRYTTSPIPPTHPANLSRKPKFPENPDPMSCCGSGCQNCVWIQYAEQVSDYFDKIAHTGKTKVDKFDSVKKALKEHVPDANLRAYLLMEVKMKL
uniref:Oxidoreductase-like domain-containing protein n=1 Tax=Panagrellus redivivus TaxID=6233 RepID=A0A7E4UWJ3_PANRE